MKPTLALLLLSLASAWGQNVFGNWTNGPSITFDDGAFALRAYVTTNFLTNAVEHWPQIAIQDTNAQPIGGMCEAMVGGKCSPIYPTAYVSDLNADTKSTEFTVTRQRLLSFEFEQRKFAQVLTNETVAHYSVEYRRTNSAVIVDIDCPDLRKCPCMYTTNALHVHVEDWDAQVKCLVLTNWFVPVRTNKIPLAIEDTHSPNLVYPMVFTNEAGKNVTNSIRISPTMDNVGKPLSGNANHN